ncbi:hypothetical protein HZI73_15580 [Vallitalea pronyensis]|uniref:Fibronectin type-III domain-containing protein n=1 Tax=Vallitalea pronyensis TaxID=1348613 RepID=A0A8J8SHN7_9FIRM|nr:kelch-like protein [Vallitalea pronyensis]QUI23622.1 hypothetical protein HZI73_15580 [Vallitalea pronyensis]
MKKYGRILGLIMLVPLMMINSLSVLGAEGEPLGTWETKVSMPTSRRRLGVIKSNNKVYAIGGSNGTFLDLVEEYDPVTGLWTTKASMPTAREDFGVGEVNGKIYAIGGYVGPSSYLATVEEYDPETDTWTSKTSMPTARQSVRVAVVNNRIYTIGGTNGSYLATVEEYDPETDTWTSKTSMPLASVGLGVAVVNNKIYAIGGGATGGAYLATVEEYNPITDTWTSKSSMSKKRSYFGVTEMNGKVFAMGGFDGSSNLDLVEEYDPVTDIWTTKANIPTARRFFDAVTLNDKIYAIGGYDTGYLATVEVFTPPNDGVTVPLNLTATASSNSITLNWDAVTDADSYTILRSTTSGSIDTVIATDVTDTTYTDTNVATGVTYYYVVRAVKNGAESADSNIASAMIEVSNNRALLLIKLLDENDKEYDLAMSDVDTFMNWYFNRGIGQGPVYYAFTKDYNTGPYISRKEYILYDKIICIEVNEYTK